MLSFKISYIKSFGYGLLISNIVVFFLFWLKGPLNYLFSGLVIIGYLYVIKSLNINDDSRVLNIRINHFVFLIIISIAWVVLSGQGGLFPQKDDLNWRNAIFHDLINYNWPVRYLDNADSSLTYYFAFWLIPAGIGKILSSFTNPLISWHSANFAYALYSIIIIITIFLLLIYYLDVVKTYEIIILTLVFVFFSGMDIVPSLINSLKSGTFSIGEHLEWWTIIQYSSNSTQLAWVFNQALPTWLVTTLLINETKMNNYAFLGLSLLPYGPIPFVGVFILLIFNFIIEIIKIRIKKQSNNLLLEVFSLQNILATITILPVFGSFYLANKAVSDNGISYKMMNYKTYIYFIIIEFLILALVLLRHNIKSRMFIISTLFLLILPLFNIGIGKDFQMRSSIPFLFILMIYTIQFIIKIIKNIKISNKHEKFRLVLVGLVLLIGAITPLNEFRVSFHKYVENRYQLFNYNDQIQSINNILDNGDNFITNDIEESQFYKLFMKNK